jgi:beta-N-acetylhexosaminidase
VDALLKKVESVAANMPLEQKVGMLLMAPLDPARLDDLLGRFYCGSLIAWGRDIGCALPAEFRALTERVQKLSLHYRNLPVWLHGYPAGDFKGGWDPGWIRRAAEQRMDIGEVERRARMFGEHWRKKLGLHNIPEPTLNVHLYDTGILQNWSISSHPDIVTAYGSAFVRGATAARCGTMAEHFPAHGATPMDSHNSFPVVDLPPDVLWRDHLAPYQRCFDGGCKTICTAHLACPALDPDPTHIATTSRVILHDVLRVKMGFEGIVIADAVEMKGFQKNGPITEVVIPAVNAGCDSLCICHMKNVEPVFNSLLRAAQDGRILPERINGAALRQLQFMDWLGIM